MVLDVKGECFEASARHRASQGDEVFRFAPTDWDDKRTHRYNSLLRIYELPDPARQQMELQLLATLFLQNDNDRVQGLLKGGIDLFVAAGLLAFQRRRPTLGEIYRIAASGGNKQKEYLARSHEVENAAARLIFTRLASTNNDTLTSYVSLLMTSGLDQWQNPAIDNATAVSDFDFRTIRKKPFSVYLVVQPLMVKPLAPLIRLFFSDLLSALQDKEPGPDEPWPVMIMLDEFNRLGKMPIVAESIEVLRQYRGHLAVVTQTIPAIDEIYGENTRRALQGNAGIKLYLTPSDEKTVEELSKAVGKTTKTVVTRSRAVGKNPFEGRSQSERTEEVSLLPEDEARRLPLDEIIVVVDAQMPVRAKRVVYFEDPFFKSIHGAQNGELPFPEGPVPPMGELPLSVRAMPTAPLGPGLTEQDLEARMGIGEQSADTRVDAGQKSDRRRARAAVLGEDQRQFEMDFEAQNELSMEPASADDAALVEDALGDLERLEGEISGESVSIDRAVSG